VVFRQFAALRRARLIDLDIQWQLNRQVIAPVLTKGATHLETMGSPFLWLEPCCGCRPHPAPATTCGQWRKRR